MLGTIWCAIAMAIGGLFLFVVPDDLELRTFVDGACSVAPYFAGCFLFCGIVWTLLNWNKT